jgi:uncharacterized protein (DUF58 family)
MHCGILSSSPRGMSTLIHLIFTLLFLILFQPFIILTKLKILLHRKPIHISMTVTVTHHCHFNNLAYLKYIETLIIPRIHKIQASRSWQMQHE